MATLPRLDSFRREEDVMYDHLRSLVTVAVYAFGKGMADGDQWVRFRSMELMPDRKMFEGLPGFATLLYSVRNGHYSTKYEAVTAGGWSTVFRWTFSRKVELALNSI